MTDAHHLKYQAHVDGLRAVAILSVILFHAGLGVSGGYVGVDIFFVISGYLITGLILKELNAGQFSLIAFWERRVRRIFPALAVVVAATVVAGWFLYFPQDFKELGQSVVAQAMLVSNFYFYLDAGYFAEGVEIKPLLHTWSLAVEEQFYLLFPLILIGIKRFARRSVLMVIFLIGVASFALSIYCSYKHSRANFYLLPGRAWELLIGSFLVTLPHRFTPLKGKAEMASLAGILAIFAALVCYDRDTRFPGLTAALPCLGAALIIWSNAGHLTWVGKMLASRPLVFIGLISYSLYLWHWPVLVFARYWAVSPMPLTWRIGLLLASVALATLSWKFVETPIRKRVYFKPRWQVFAFGGTATAIFLLAGLAVFKAQGVPKRIPDAALQFLANTGNPLERTNAVTDRQLTLKNALEGDFNQFGVNDTNQPVELLVWGDSHAQVETPILNLLGKDHAVRGMAAIHSQTAPLVGYESHGVWSLGKDSVAYNRAVVDFIQKNKIGNVLIIARWDYYIDADKGTGRLHDGLVATVAALQGAGAQVWILRQVPKYPWNVPKALASAVLHGHDPDALGLSPIEQRANDESSGPIFAGITNQFPNVRILDPEPLFMDASGWCRVVKDGKVLYFDTDHVSPAGAMELRPLFEPIFEAAGKPSVPVASRNVNRQ